MIEHGFIGGDGGPIIVLQASAISQWKGAVDFEDSLMNGGALETDYDVICESKKHILKRYDCDMLVLDDSEWCTHVFTLSSGAIAFVQPYGTEENVGALLNRLFQTQPSESFPMDVQDTFLRLLVGADDGNGSCYSYEDVPIVPGTKRCDLFLSSDELVLIINAV